MPRRNIKSCLCGSCAKQLVMLHAAWTRLSFSAVILALHLNQKLHSNHIQMFPELSDHQYISAFRRNPLLSTENQLSKMQLNGKCDQGIMCSLLPKTVVFLTTLSLLRTSRTLLSSSRLFLLSSWGPSCIVASAPLSSRSIMGNSTSRHSVWKHGDRFSTSTIFQTLFNYKDKSSQSVRKTDWFETAYARMMFYFIFYFSLRQGPERWVLLEV